MCCNIAAKKQLSTRQGVIHLLITAGHLVVLACNDHRAIYPHNIASGLLGK
jgi:hypothetical protein